MSASRVAHFSWTSPEVAQCPYPFYDALREEAPVHRIPGSDTYLVTRWEDIATVTQDAKLFKQDYSEADPDGWRQFNQVPFPAAPPGRYVPVITGASDGEDHRVKRRWGLALVEPDRLRTYEPLLREMADELIDAFIDRGECEFRRDFAELLPVHAICRLLGVSRSDWELFVTSADALAVGYGSDAPDRQCALARALHALFDHLGEEVLERYKHPTDDFLSELVRVQVERDGGLDLNYQIIQATNLVIAGAETTASAMTSMMLLLCRNPEQMARVRADPALLRPAFEESLRLETPVQWIQRVCTAETTLGGVRLPAGALLLVVYGAGNRDPRCWAQPDAFSLDRPELAKRQLAFGRGAHRCLGAPLARLEAEVGFERLLSRTRDIRLLEEQSDLSNPDTTFVRAFKAVRIAFDRA